MRPIWGVVAFVLALFSISGNVHAQPYLNENSTWVQNLTPTMWASQIFGDLNKDGYLDLVLIGDSDSGKISKVYTNNGSTLQENASWQHNLTGVHYGSIVLGDIDNDGDLDLLLSGCSSGGGYVPECDDTGYQTLVYTNNGSGFLENVTWQNNLEKVWRGSLALGDINNDGYLDLVLTGRTLTNRISRVYMNNGITFIENSTWQNNLIGVDSSSVAFADLDNDGDLDLILSGKDMSSSKNTKIYTNNGTTFNENNTWQQNLEVVIDSSVTVGDIDNDGDLDLSVIGCCDIHRTYNNTGTTFQEIQREITHFAGVFAGSQLFSDYDNDGLLDIITTGREEYTSLYSNTGNGVFTDYWSRPEKQIMNLEYSHVLWGDIDNDGNLDLFINGYGGGGGGWYQSKIYTNNITTKNTVPDSPNSNLNNSYNFSTGKLTLSWGTGLDTETAASGLYYNLRIGTCSKCNDVVSGVFGGGDDNGYFGNMVQRKSITLNRPDLENETIYWAVQTIDTGLAKSTWSTEQVLEITQSCTENWSYGTWSSCIGGQQTRTTTDLNNCGTEENKSATTQSCSSPPSGPSGPSGSVTLPDDDGYTPEENVTNTSDLGSQSNINETENKSGELEVKVCSSGELKCELDKLLECSFDGLEWLIEEICEFSCLNGTCVEEEKNAGLINPAWYIAIGVIVVIGGFVVAFRRSRIPGSSLS